MTKKVMPNQHPLILWFDRESGAQRMSFTELARKAGLDGSTLTEWRLRGTLPSIANFDAVCQVLGYRLVVEKVES